MRKTPLILATALLALFLLPASASAYRFNVDNLGASGSVSVDDLDTAQGSTLRVMNGGVEAARLDSDAGADYHEVTATVQPGWVIEVYQPKVVGPPGGAPTAKLVVPNVTVTPVPGSTAVTGTGPDGWSIQAQRSASCFPLMEMRTALVSGGNWSAALRTPIKGQDQFGATALSPSGDTVSTVDPIKAPGDGQCVMVMAATNTPATSSKPFSIGTSGLDPAIPSTRIVLRRGAAVLADANNSSTSLPPTAKPSPGDTIDVYRPQGAPTPAYSWTIPQISSVYDIGANLIAVDGPAASRVLGAPCRPFNCDPMYMFYGQPTLNTPAGRTLLSMAAQQVAAGPYDLSRTFLPGDKAIAGWVSPNGAMFYFLDSVEGDLTSPTGKASLSKSTSASKLAKSGRLKFKLTSSEAGKAASSLTIAAKKKGKKPVKLGSAKGAVKAGSNKISLKLSKSGKKAVKKLARSGKSVKATLTITLTDASGNATTVVKTTTLKV
jgi:hypothetical protein